ncbi:MAG: trigger factor [Bacteroidales bacterium]|nr:trigger factor [Bacteroidales bacterium]
MNITQESTGNLTATIKVEIIETDYQEEVEKALRDHRRKAAISGFRPGKVPFGMIKKMYGKAVLAEEVNKILSESLENYLKENKIEILGQPLPGKERDIDIDFDIQKDFEFYFDIGMTPDFDLSLSDKINVNYYTINADDKMLDNQIQEIRHRHGVMSEVDITKEGDLVKGDLTELDETGEKKIDGIVNTTSISLNYIKDEDIREKFIGIKKDDQVIFNPLKATGNAVETASMLGIQKEDAEKMNSEFNFSVNEVSRLMPADLNENLYKLAFPAEDMKSEEEFRQRVRKDMSNSFVVDSDKQFMNESVIALVNEADISLPEDFLRRYILEVNEDKLTEEKLDEDFDNYLRSMKWQLIENQIIKDHTLNVTDEDIKNYIRNYFSGQFFKTDEEKEDESTKERLNNLVKMVMENKEEVKKIYDHLYDNRLRELLKSTIKINNKEISYEEFAKLVSETKL